MSLNVVRAGSGRPVVLLHGLTATHRYVVMGSKSLERSGHDVVAYDARGHGRSDPGEHYDYDALAADLLGVMDAAGFESATLAGASMGAHTALKLAIERPERVAGLVVMTPGFDPVGAASASSLRRWDALAEGLRDGGVEGFIAAYGQPTRAEQWNELLVKVLRQRMAEHEFPGAVADALEQIPRSSPFESLDQLAGIGCPVAVVGSRDEPDPGHPLELARRYAQALAVEPIVEEPGTSPIAWQGGRVSRLIAEIAQRAEG